MFIASNIDWFITQLIDKFRLLGFRIISWWTCLPMRLKRWYKHLSNGLQTLFAPKSINSIIWWWGLWLIYSLEIIGIGEIYESIIDAFKFNTRALNKYEIGIAKTVFGDSIKYKMVRIDNQSYLGPKQGRFAYVSFFTINFWGEIEDSTLIHELVHIWQYQQMGAVYMPIALNAQHSVLRYNYEGIEGLMKNKNIGIHTFNLEQQGDIIADYFRIKNNCRPRWGSGTKEDLRLYEMYINQIKTSK